MKFNYRARMKDGKMEIGMIEAYSKEAAINLLQKNDIFVTSLEPQLKKASLWQRIKLERKPSKKDLAIFFRQLSVMLESQVPVVQSLASLSAEVKNKTFKKTILDVSNLVEEGVPLSQAFASHAATFPNFYVNLIKSGEASGKIAPALYSISNHLEREHEVISQVRQAMIYPLFLIGVLFFVLWVVITQIVPKIKDLVAQTGNNPTSFAQSMLGVYDFLGKYWWFIFLLFSFLVVSLILYFKTEEGKKEYDKISLRIPFVKDLFKKVFLIRFCANVSTLLLAGVSINRALHVAQDTVNNFEYKKIVADLEKKVSEGERLSFAMAKYPGYFPPFVLQIAKVGEATGKLDKSLIDIVDFYEKEIKSAIDLFSRLLEPIMIIILGGIVALLAFSVLSSIYGAIGTI